MEEAIIKNIESSHSKGYIIFPKPLIFYFKRQGGDHCEAESSAPAKYEFQKYYSINLNIVKCV